ncbi:HIT family protein [Promicromonospora sp. NPDC090134]|uniref:HIT family protein n=1 Tax=Promicromonospora sp. NPDC090134 TaxID=3364408 RepID=UPI0037FF8CBD
MTSEAHCLFCRIVRGELPSTRIDEDARTLTFMDINPASDGHALVIPKAHSRDLHDIAPEDLTGCTLTAQRIAGRATKQLGADGVNILSCAGEAAWQTVFHFHIHVVPRFRGEPSRDSLRLPWEPTPGDPGRIAAAAKLLRATL